MKLMVPEPEVVLSAEARAQIDRSIKWLLEQLSVCHWTISYYHSQGNPAERYIHTVSGAVRNFVFQNNGDQRMLNLLQIHLALNTTRKPTTKTEVQIPTLRAIGDTDL